MKPILAIHPVAWGMLLIALVLILGAFIVWLVKNLHGGEVNDTQAVHDSLTKFRELHARGGLSDDEYRTIKTKLAAEIDPKLGDPQLGAAEVGSSEADD